MLHSRIDVQIALLTFLRIVLVPTVAIATLVASMALLNVEFTEPYIALAIIAALLMMPWSRATRFSRQTPSD